MFTVDPSEISPFGGKKLVELLRLLLHAEARKTGVPMRNVDVPLQITVADGGKDGSVLWQDGEDSTDYFPCRDVVFQCKATDYGDAQWKSEVWSKGSKAKSKKALNQAVEAVLDRGGSYIGVTATPLVGDKLKSRAKAIRQGIEVAGGDPSRLHTVEVYDGNKLAAWASVHPAVALWVKEQAKVPLAGFSTLAQWGKRADIVRPAFVDSPDRKFTIGQEASNTLNFTQLAGRLVDDLAEEGACIRLTGPSGIGKTRALHHALSTSTGSLQRLTESSFIFCDYREVAGRLWELAHRIVNDGLAAVLVVDECPRDEAQKLNGIARAEDSKLRVVTIDTDGRPLDCLMISPHVADGEVIRGILALELKNAKPEELTFVAELCAGFPRIAVLAAQAYKNGQTVMKSADDVAERIVATARLEREPVRALECLSLFDRVAPDAPPAAFDMAAERLAHMKGEIMYEHLVAAAEQHLVGRYGGEMSVQPRPIADYLGLKRLAALRPSTIIAFLLDGPETYRDNMLARFRHLARSPVLSEVVLGMVHRGQGLSEPHQLLSDDAGPFLPAFVHVAPDAMAGALRNAISTTPINDLAAGNVSDGLLDALRLLATRRQSFKSAASSLIRLVAAHGDNALLERLRQLFQVALAGTEASDGLRQDLLLEMLQDDDLSVKRACVEALGAMLTTYATRFGEMDQIGAESIRADWVATTQDTVRNYFEWSLEQLLQVWRTAPALRPRIQRLAAEHFRTFIDFGLFETIEAFVRAVVAEAPWPEATKALGDWLYFDRPTDEDNLSASVRALYDHSLPADPVELALFYSRYWPADIRDPDARYGQSDLEDDLRYGEKQIALLAPKIARNAAQLERVFRVMTTEEMHAPQALAKSLAENFQDPVMSFGRAVTVLDQSGQRLGLEFVRAMLRTLDRVLDNQADIHAEVVKIAWKSEILAANPMNVFTALKVTDESVAKIAVAVSEGQIGPFHVVPISYGKGLDKVSPEALGGLITALVDRTADGGAWAALEVLSMRTHDFKVLDAATSELVKMAVLSPAISDGIKGNATTGDYVLERLVKLLRASNAIDDSFAEAFAQQIVRACRSDVSGYARQSDALRAVLKIVMAVSPEPVWAVVAGFFETATRLERQRLDRIIASTKLFAQEANRAGAGVLFATSEETMIEWADADPEGRAGFLVSIYPLLYQVNGKWAWHPAFSSLAARYGKTRSFRASLSARILPSSWGGSLTPHLTAFQTALATWKEDPILGEWAAQMAEDVDRWLSIDT